eukprot:m.1618915 g.1618915  ORF g.1618915 m.1618915 type:complete len:279 (-) comp25378_c0_seq4:4041-4877(-)
MRVHLRCCAAETSLPSAYFDGAGVLPPLGVAVPVGAEVGLLVAAALATGVDALAGPAVAAVGALGVALPLGAVGALDVVVVLGAPVPGVVVAAALRVTLPPAVAMPLAVGANGALVGGAALVLVGVAPALVVAGLLTADGAATGVADGLVAFAFTSDGSGAAADVVPGTGFDPTVVGTGVAVARADAGAVFADMGDNSLLTAALTAGVESLLFLAELGEEYFPLELFTGVEGLDPLPMDGDPGCLTRLSPGGSGSGLVVRFLLDGDAPTDFLLPLVVR